MEDSICPSLGQFVPNHRSKCIVFPRCLNSRRSRARAFFQRERKPTRGRKRYRVVQQALRGRREKSRINLGRIGVRRGGSVTLPRMASVNKRLGRTTLTMGEFSDTGTIRTRRGRARRVRLVRNLGSHLFAAHGTAITICMWELRPEPVTQISCFPVTEVQSWVLLNQCPLEAVDGVSLEKGFVFCGCEGAP